MIQKIVAISSTIRNIEQKQNLMLKITKYEYICIQQNKLMQQYKQIHIINKKKNRTERDNNRRLPAMLGDVRIIYKCVVVMVSVASVHTSRMQTTSRGRWTSVNSSHDFEKVHMKPEHTRSTPRDTFSLFLESRRLSPLSKQR